LIKIETTPENCPMGIQKYSEYPTEYEYLMRVNTFLNVKSVTKKDELWIIKTKISSVQDM
jgi:hypothetical protein